MSEAVMWKYLKPKLEKHATAVRISDRHLRGFPDLIVSDRRLKSMGVNGWATTRKAGLIEMKFIPEGKPRIGIRPDQAIFAFNWAKHGYAGVLVREGDDWWHFIHVSDNPEWMQKVQGKDWRDLVPTCATSFDVKTHGPNKLADWVLSQLFDNL